MTRKLAFALLLATPALGGCAVQAAMAAHQLSQQVRLPAGPSNAHLRQAATDACTQRAATYGSVLIVDVEQRRRDRLIVWGSVTGANQQRRTFQCHFTTRLVSFELADILPPR